MAERQMPHLEQHMRHSVIGGVDGQSFDVPDLAVARTNSVAPMDIYLAEGNGLVDDDLRSPQARRHRRSRTVADEVSEAAALRHLVLLLGGVERPQIVGRAAKSYTAAYSRSTPHGGDSISAPASADLVQFTWMRASGCYEWNISGRTFHETVVVRATPHKG